MVADLVAGASGSSPQDLTSAAGTLFFTVDDGTHGQELWASDGTAAGTALVKDINAGTNSSSPSDLTAVGGTLFFAAYDGTHGWELWTSDGTAAGTALVKDINPGTDGSGPTHLTASGGSLFFTAYDGTHGEELWTSDGTAAGTTLVKDINPGADGSGPTHLTASGGSLFFTADDDTHGRELWTSDGTAAGTTLVKDITVGTNYYGPTYLAAVGGALFFSANDGTHGRELWTSDGTAAGTTLVKDINPATGGYGPGHLTAVAGRLFFSADDGTHGEELWTSDGTTVGTTLVKDVNTGTGTWAYSELEWFTAVGGSLFFRADDGTHGEELWTSDGTTVGTTLVKDIMTGGGSTPYGLTAVDGNLFFSADDGVHRQELWTSDGTTEGTTMVKDIDPDPGYYSSSFPNELTAVGGTLFFTADDGTHGRELWRTVTGTGPVDNTPPDTTITAGPGEGATVTGSSVTFSFAGTAGDTTKLQCKLDGAPFEDCTSPHTFVGLVAGGHTVAFRAVDAAGNIDPTPASRSFIVQATPTSPSPASPPPASPPPASNAFTLPAKGKPNRKKGSLRLSITLPGAGTLTYSSSGKALIKPGKVTVGSFGPVQVNLSPTKAAQKQLKRAAKGKLSVKVKFTYTPTGGSANTQTRAYTLTRK